MGFVIYAITLFSLSSGTIKGSFSGLLHYSRRQAKKLLQQYSIPQTYHSMVLIENGKAYTKSTAALRIARKLSGAWPLFSIFRIVPQFIRNRVYDFIARNRYRWFGRADHCIRPTAQLRAKFIP